MSKQIADTILAQLGGQRFIVMTGAKNFTYDAAGTLSFHLPRGFARNKANLVRIAYDAGADLYTLTFSKFFKLNVTEVSTHERLYADMLREVFTRETGLDTNL